MTSVPRHRPVIDEMPLQNRRGTANRSHLTREEALSQPAILQVVQELLEHAFKARKAFFKPIYQPAAERNAYVVQVLRQAVAEHRQRGGVLAQVADDREMLLALYHHTALAWGPAQKYFDDDSNTEVIVNGIYIHVLERGSGTFVDAPEHFADPYEVERRVRYLAEKQGTPLDDENPQRTILLEGARGHMSIPPRTCHGPYIAIRRGRTEPWDGERLLQVGSLDADGLALVLHIASVGSVLISGDMNVGKTTFLEALLNSLPGRPKIMTIEDNTAEIMLTDHQRWTPMKVKGPQEFDKVIIETLRQAAEVVTPGEIRNFEAGAAVAIAQTGPRVFTSIHGCDEEAALYRMASCAARPGSAQYEGRRDDALRDICANFDLVIHLKRFPGLGRRVLGSACLVDRAVIDRRDNALRPRLIPLLKARLTPDGQSIVWEKYARINDHGALVWLSGKDQTPAKLQDRLIEARAMVGQQAVRSTLEVIEETLTTAQRLVRAGEPARALAELQAAWDRRHSERLLAGAKAVLAVPDPALGLLIQEAQERWQHLQDLMAGHHWRQARAAYTTLYERLAWAAAVEPLETWQALAVRITQGEALVEDAERSCAEAAAMVTAGYPDRALDRVVHLSHDRLPQPQAQTLLQVRLAAHEQLLERGLVPPESLDILRGMLHGYVDRAEGATV